MRTFKTQEQQDGFHRVIQGRIGLYGPGDIVPREVAMQMRAGRPVDIGHGYKMR